MIEQFHFIPSMMSQRETLSFSVANILSDKSPAVSEDADQQRGNQFAQLKSPYNILNSKRQFSSSSIDTTFQETDYAGHGARNGDHDGFLVVCSTTSRSPLCSPLPSTTSPFDGDELSNGDFISPDAKSHPKFVVEDDDGLVDEVESRSPRSKDKLNAPKRGRMRFSPEQVQVLERRFQEQHYLLPADRKILSLALRLSERQVKTWFQNKRAQYKRTRPLVRSPVYHTVSPTVGCRSLQQLWSPGSPSFYSSPSHAIGINLRLMCSSPSSFSPLRTMATPTHPTSPCNAIPTFFHMPASPTLNFTYPTVAATQVQTISMSAPK